MSEIEIVGGLMEHYTQVPNEIFRTPGIRSRAVHVFGNLRSHRSGWKTNIRNVAKSTGLSNNTVMAAINDLIELGYIEREKIPGTAGRFDTYKYRVLDTPRLKKEDRPEPYQEVRQEPSQNVSQEPVSKSKTLKKNPSKNTKREDQSNGHPPADRFEEFYDAYDRKKKRPDAERAWSKAAKKVDPQTIIDAAQAFITAQKVANKHPHFTPYPATWLNAESWNDEIDDPQPQSTARGFDNSPEAWGIPSGATSFQDAPISFGFDDYINHEEIS